MPARNHLEEHNHSVAMFTFTIVGDHKCVFFMGRKKYYLPSRPRTTKGPPESPWRENHWMANNSALMTVLLDYKGGGVIHFVSLRVYKGFQLESEFKKVFWKPDRSPSCRSRSRRTWRSLGWLRAFRPWGTYSCTSRCWGSGRRRAAGWTEGLHLHSVCPTWVWWRWVKRRMRKLNSPCHSPELSDQQVIVARQADRDNVVCERDPPLRPDESQVVLVREEVVLRVDNFLGGLQLQVLVRFAGRYIWDEQRFRSLSWIPCWGEIPFAHPHPYLRNHQAEKVVVKKMKTLSLLTNINSLINAVASCCDPVFIDKRSSASVSRGETKEGRSSHRHLTTTIMEITKLVLITLVTKMSAMQSP